MSAPPRGLSQLPTSFVDFLCQGIRRAPLSSYSLTRVYEEFLILVTIFVSSNIRLRSYRPCREPPTSLHSHWLMIFDHVDSRGIRSGRTPRAMQMSRCLGAGALGAGCWIGGTALRAGGQSECLAFCFRGGEHLLDPLRTRVSRLPRKEVIQPHLPVRLPCYDFTPLTLHTFDASAPCGFGRRLRVQTTRVV